MDNNRRERRKNDPEIRKRAEEAQALKSQQNAGGGYGNGMPGAKPATGAPLSVNPFMIPKPSGLTITSKTFPNAYFQLWDLSAWRMACDQAQKMGYPIQLAAMYSWTFESSLFIQSLFQQISVAVSKIPVQLVDEKGNPFDEWNKEIVEKKWFKDLLKEAIFSKFWGFSGINFDVYSEQIYKYPMQDIDPINRYLKESTFNYGDGLNFSDTANLLFFQPSTSYEAFLGWMQPLSRMYIMINMMEGNWAQAGKRHAFPITTIGYPQADQKTDLDGNVVNPSQEEAERIAREFDTSEILTYPYTLDINGNTQKKLLIGEETASGGTGQRHKMFSDFNTEQQNQARELIFGGTLTSSVGSKGSLALGDVHMEKYQAQILSLVEDGAAMLNNTVDGFLKKIRTFYSNFPKNARLSIDRAKQWNIEEVAKISPLLVANGKKLTDEFFEGMGLAPTDFEDAPAPPMPTFPSTETVTESAKLKFATEKELKKKALKQY